MDQTLYFTLVLIVICSVSECIQRRYYYVDVSKSWAEAQSSCRELYTDLATVNNMNDMKHLMESVKKQDVHVWIGLQNTGGYKWKWSLGDPVSYTNWKIRKSSEESSEESSVQNCAFIKEENDGWHLQNCNNRMHFICYNETSKYIVEKPIKNWMEAQRFCRENHTDLASVRNKTENDHIVNIIKEGKIDKVWIGLFSDVWEWSDNNDSIFRNWMPNEPNGGDLPQCAEVQMNQQGEWNDKNCFYCNTFVCHEDKLVLINESLSWTDALKYCRENHVDLVSVDSEEIQQWVTEVLEQDSTEAVWLGLRHSCTVGIWFWVNGEIVCDENWAPGNGTADEDCDSVLRSGAVQTEDHHWISRPETDKLNFICIRYD